MINKLKREKRKKRIASAIQLSTRNGWKSEASSAHLDIPVLKKKGWQISTGLSPSEKKCGMTRMEWIILAGMVDL
jgi:hypothetical protein